MYLFNLLNFTTSDEYMLNNILSFLADLLKSTKATAAASDDSKTETDQSKTDEAKNGADANKNGADVSNDVPETKGKEVAASGESEEAIEATEE